MNTVEAGTGKAVTLSYSIILEDGTKIGDQTTGPLTFTIGAGEVFPALEQGVAGMQIGEMRKIKVLPEEGYGSYNDELVLRVDREAFPEDMRLIPGRTIQYQNHDGQRANFVVQEVSAERVTLDGNHPLAGQELIYQVELLNIG